MGHSKTDSVVYLDPSLNTSNLGDAIIRLAVEHWFLEPLERAGRQVHRLPLTRSLDHDERELLRAAEDIVLGGTNRLSAHMRFRHRYWNWPRDQIESCFNENLGAALALINCAGSNGAPAAGHSVTVTGNLVQVAVNMNCWQVFKGWKP